MKQAQLVSSVTLASSLLLGLTVVHYPTEQNHSAASSRKTLHATQTKRTPVRDTLRVLQAAAQPLAYFPTMERAIAAAYPDELKATNVFQDAEVTLFGVGPLMIGMTLEEATNALGVPLVPLGRNLSGECAYYQPETTAQTLGLMVVDEHVIRIDIWPGSTLATTSGVAIGTPETDVVKTYSGKIEATPNPYTKGKFLTLVPEDPELSLYRLVFETDVTGRVIQYRTGQFPAVTWPDGCV